MLKVAPCTAGGKFKFFRRGELLLFRMMMGLRCACCEFRHYKGQLGSFVLYLVQNRERKRRGQFFPIPNKEQIQRKIREKYLPIDDA